MWGLNSAGVCVASVEDIRVSISCAELFRINCVLGKCEMVLRALVAKEAAGSWINWGSIKCDINGPQHEVFDSRVSCRGTLFKRRKELIKFLSVYSHHIKFYVRN